MVKKGRKFTGGKYRKSRKVRKYERAKQPRKTRVGEEKGIKLRGIGGNIKYVLLSTNKANITEKNGKSKVAKIISVIETPSNRFWARANLLCKGAIIETDMGKAKITNRPTQEGSVNAILIN